MSQHDYVIDNGSGAVVRSDINNLAQAIATNNSGTSAPSTTYPYMWWPDVTNSLLKQRNGANTAWITIGPLDTASFGFLGSSSIGVTVQGYDANTAKLNVQQVFSKQQTPLKAALTDASTVTWDCATAQVATLTTSAARIIGAPTNGVSGTYYGLEITTGGYTPAWNAVFDFGGDGVPSGLTGVCGFLFYYDGSKFRCRGRSFGGA